MVWKLINSVISKRKRSKVIKQFRNGDNYVTDPKDITNQFNSFFVNVGKSLADKIPNTPMEPEFFLKGNYSNSFYFSPVIVHDITSIISFMTHFLIIPNRQFLELTLLG